MRCSQIKRQIECQSVFSLCDRVSEYVKQTAYIYNTHIYNILLHNDKYIVNNDLYMSTFTYDIHTRYFLYVDT